MNTILNSNDCIICKKHAAYLGIFFATPTFSKRIGAQRVAYGVCVVCIERPSLAEDAEEIILRKLQVQ